jgi:excisionase family DNA binding protein
VKSATLVLVRRAIRGFTNEPIVMRSNYLPGVTAKANPDDLMTLTARIERLEALFGSKGARVPVFERKTCSVDEACKLIPVGKTRLYALIAKGVIDSIKVGRSRRIVIASLPGFEGA